MRLAVKRGDSAAPPTSTGRRMPAAVMSVAETTIICADLTSSPDRPMASGLWAFTASSSCSGAILMPRSTTL